MKNIGLSLFAAVTFGASPVLGALNFNITEVTQTTISFSITGTLSGTPKPDGDANFSYMLFLQPLPGDKLFVGPSGFLYVNNATISGSPLTDEPLYLDGATQGVQLAVDEPGDWIGIIFENYLAGGEIGNGNVITVDLSPTAYTISPSVSEIGLYWGYNDEIGQPFGDFQSSATFTPVPEPGMLGVIMGLAALTVVARRRR